MLPRIAVTAGEPAGVGPELLAMLAAGGWDAQLVAVGSADLVAYFFLRVWRLLSHGGMTGMLATNTIAQGDTREVGLDQMTTEDATITGAISKAPQ